MIHAGMFLLAAFTASAVLGQVEFRAIGGPGHEHARAVVPHATGAFLAGVAKPEDADVARGYVVHYGNDLEHEWSVLLPFGDPIEHVVDAWLDSPGVATLLTERFVQGVGYKAAIHTIDSTGTWLGSHEPAMAFRPTCMVKWNGDPWIVGTSSAQPAAYNVETGSLIAWAGAPGATEEVADAAVANGLLVAVGSRTAHDTSQAVIWAVYPLGQVAFELAQPDTTVQRWSRCDAVAAGPNGVRVLSTYGAPTPGNPNVESTLHSMLSLNVNQGKINGVLYGPSSGNRPGRDLIWTDNGWVKLSQTDLVPELDQSILVTHYNAFGGYVSQGAWGTSYEDSPVSVVAADDGSLWVAGSTRGTLDGTWNACLLRLDSLGPLDQWFTEPAGFGVLNDPLFNTFTDLEDFAGAPTWGVAPNPARHATRLHGGLAGMGTPQWQLFDVAGRAVCQGQGWDVSLDGVAPGMHRVVVTDRTGTAVVPLVVAE